MLTKTRDATAKMTVEKHTKDSAPPDNFIRTCGDCITIVGDQAWRDGHYVWRQYSDDKGGTVWRPVALCRIHRGERPNGL